MGKRNRTSSFIFRLSTPSVTEFKILFSFPVFRFPTTLKMKFQFLFSFSSRNFRQQNTNCHFFFWSFLFVRYSKSEFAAFDFRFSLMSFCHFRMLPTPEDRWYFLSLTINLETTSLMQSLFAVFL